MEIKWERYQSLVVVAAVLAVECIEHVLMIPIHTQHTYLR